MPDTVAIPRPLVNAILHELERSAHVLAETKERRPFILIPRRDGRDDAEVDLDGDDVSKLAQACLSAIRALHAQLRRNLEISTSVLQSLEKEKKRIDGLFAGGEDVVNMDLLRINITEEDVDVDADAGGRPHAGIEEIFSMSVEEEEKE